jgi:hypothetical protein
VNGWTRPLLSRTRTWAVALADTHKAWSNHSLQTLQRVGSMIRSTSLDCLAALGSKKGGAGAAAASQLPQHDQGSGPDGDDEDNSIVRASLSQFLSAASDAEVSHAARLADLSNMAYDVLDVTPERLQQAHGLTLVAHSRSSTASQQQQQKAQLPEQAAQQQHSLLLLQGRGVAEPQHTGLPQQPLPQGPWPVPVMLLQPSGISTQAAGGADWSSSSSSVGLPASPRTPAIMASYAEDDFVLGSAAAATAGEYQPVPAAGFYVDVGSPRRPSAAGNAAVATMARPAAPAMAGSPPAYGPVPQDDSSTSRLAGAGQHSADYYYSSSWPVAQYPQMLEQEYPQLSEEEEAALLQQLKQQEAWVLLEMQASQQMMMLLQQSQAASAPDGSPAQQELQLLQEVAAAAAASSSITAAASTAAAAALAGSSSSGAAEDFLPASSAAAAAGNPDAPADWFACDGPLSDSDATPTRFFAIQGSITLEHWRINLTIDPVEFEGGALGPIRVHRGMYEAALEMYDQILPHVQQHLAAHPQGKIALTGHSLGGSLATLLMLLMVHRCARVGQR